MQQRPVENTNCLPEIQHDEDFGGELIVGQQADHVQGRQGTRWAIMHVVAFGHLQWWN